eukprot:3856912-Prymnesium_polylepis.1
MVSALEPRSPARARHLARQHPHITHFHLRASRCLQRQQRSHRLERIPQVNATSGLAACEQAAQSASL